MTRFLLLVILLLCTPVAFTQRFINMKQDRASRIIDKIYKDSLATIATQQTGNSVAFQLRHSQRQNLDITLHFNNDGRCVKETYQLNCDSCYRKFVDHLLSKKKFGFVRAGNQYYSGLPYKLVLTTHTPAAFAYTVEKSTMPNREYRQLLKNKKGN